MRGPVPADRLGHELARREFLGLAGAALAGLAVATPLGRRPRPVHVRDDELSVFIRDRMRSARVPGLGACIMKDDAIAWSRGYGWANLARRDGVDDETVFMLASISKTVMAVAAMQAVEAGLLSLDADVNDVCPFQVRTPSFPDIPITLRMLLTHSSSIRDNWTNINQTYVQGDSSTPLGDYLRAYLEPGGHWYDERHNFSRVRPGSAYDYCNIAAALAGYLVETASGTAFDRWCEERIFTPLAMPQTSWHLAGLDRSRIAMPYRFRRREGTYSPYGQYGYPDYPDGELRTSARQLAHHLLAFIGFGEYRGARVLRPDTVQEMRRSQLPGIRVGQGLIWYTFHLHGRRLMGHNGGDSGVATQMYFRPDDGAGVIALANGDWRRTGTTWPLQQIVGRLFDEADRL